MDERDTRYEPRRMHMTDGAPNVRNMDLLDYFAGKALAGMHARDAFDPGQSTPEQRAKLAYIDARAMLAEREK